MDSAAKGGHYLSLLISSAAICRRIITDPDQLHQWHVVNGGELSNQIKSNGIKIKCLIRYHLEIQSSPMEKMLDELVDSLPTESNSIITVDVGGVVVAAAAAAALLFVAIFLLLLLNIRFWS